MPRIYLILSFLLLVVLDSSAQELLDLGSRLSQDNPLQEEYILFDDEPSKRATITTPPNQSVRPMAEWEEIDAITISWHTYKHALSQIVKHAQKECKVYINCLGSAEEVQVELDSFNVNYGENVIFLENQNFNSVWIRDYGPNSAYTNDVDSLIMVDWIYNRERPDDDILPENIANVLNVPLYETIEGESSLTATGGNFMTDGIETGFSSRLVLHENQHKTEADIDKVMADFLGVKNYVKFDTLVYDGIHHIDMHMKLLDEERIIFGQYPKGRGDHGIIEANIEFLLATQTNAFGEPYEIIRIPMPPDLNGSYPGDNGIGTFNTYTNALFINKTILVPTYESIHVNGNDAEALRIWEEAMPGYNIVGINCNSLIGAFGAIHCVTKEIGAKNPIRIVFQKIKDQDEVQHDGYPLIAKVQHRFGVEQVNLYFREKGSKDYNHVKMNVADPVAETYEATIPDFIDRGSIEYYVEAVAKSGKRMLRPQPAPLAYYSFDIASISTSAGVLQDVFKQDAFPNPSNQLVCIPVNLSNGIEGDLSLIDIHGRRVESIHAGTFPSGESKYFTNVSNLPTGIYTLRLASKHGISSQKLVVKN